MGRPRSADRARDRQAPGAFSQKSGWRMPAWSSARQSKRPGYGTRLHHSAVLKKPVGRTQTPYRPAQLRNSLHASAAGTYRVRAGGNVGLRVPIRNRPLSPSLAGVARAGGKLGLIVPIRNLPLSAIAGLGLCTTFSEPVSFTEASIWLVPNQGREHNILLFSELEL